jgi:hypothetical protein
MERGMTLGESTVISNREVIGGFIMQLRKYIYIQNCSQEAGRYN